MNKSLNDLEKELNSGKLRSLYLLYGNEKYLIENMVRKIKKQFGELVQGINFVMIDETNSSDLIFNIEVPAFGYDKKLILVKHTGLLKKDGRKKTLTPLQQEVKEYIEENISVIEEMAVVVFWEDEIDKNAVYDAISQKGVVCQIDELKPAQLVAKLKQVCGLYQVMAEENVLQYLIEVSGTDLQVLMGEIRKLIEYAGEGGRITRDAIDNLTIHKIESVIFELTDNLGHKKTDNAMAVLDHLIYQKEPLQKILVTLYNHFKKLYLCSRAMRMNKDIIASLNLKPNQTFLVSKYKKQTAFFQEKDLREILQKLVEIDDQSKIGRLDIDVALRSVLCGYCS